MTHYETLGVAADATPQEIRRAYLAHARRHHPDRHHTEGERAATAAEARMRRINEAWQVLGDADRRAAYDRKLSHPPNGAAHTEPVHTAPAETAPSFVPYRPDTPEDPDEDDSWRFEPDEGDPATVPPQALLAAPPMLFLAGLVSLVLSVVLGQRAWSAVGVILMFASALLFVGAPLVALFRSRLVEDRAARRRR